MQKRILNDGGNLLGFLFRTRNLPKGPESAIVDTTRQEQLGEKKKKKRLAVKAVLPIQGILSSFLKKADSTAFSSGP